VPDAEDWSPYEIFQVDPETFLKVEDASELKIV
jgi:hypothetical protein